MSRKTDLEQHIRKSYSLIHKYENIRRLSGDPKEVARAELEIEEQWELIEDYLDEYLTICRSRNASVPSDIDEIRARFQSTTLPRSPLPDTCESGSVCHVAATGKCIETVDPPSNIRVPEGYFYLGCSDRTNLHSFFRKRDKQVVILILCDRYTFDSFLIDKFQITAQQYALFLNSCQEQGLVQLRQVGQKKSAVDANGYAIAFDALDQWQTGAHSRVPWRFAANPWGITNQGERWTPISGCERLPATFVTWRGALLYSLWANGQEMSIVEGKTAYLPTEEQWETAALWDPLTGLKRRFPWGNRWDLNRLNSASHWAGRTIENYDQRANWWDADPAVCRQIRPLEVDRFREGMSPSECVQILGNVWEWCADIRSVRGHKQRATKGGACISPQNECMPEYCSQFNPHSSTEYQGFRCCCPFPG
jgi:formylglycine-generating enzyme required for sulfatase activity